MLRSRDKSYQTAELAVTATGRMTVHSVEIRKEAENLPRERGKWEGVSGLEDSEKRGSRKLTIHDFDDVFFETADEAAYFYSCYAYCMGFCWKHSRVEKKEVDGVKVVTRRDFMLRTQHILGNQPCSSRIPLLGIQYIVFWEEEAEGCSKGTEIHRDGCGAKFKVKYDQIHRKQTELAACGATGRGRPSTVPQRGNVNSAAGGD